MATNFNGNVVEDIVERDDSYQVTIDGVTMHVPKAPGNRHYTMVQGAIDLGEPVTQWVPPPPPVPELTFAQLLIGLVAEEWITQMEGEAWLAGTPPAAVETLISGLPVEQQFAARARAVRPSVVVRSDPLVIALATMEGKTSEQMDTFFRTYSQV
jgi:hypothetical protein